MSKEQVRHYIDDWREISDQLHWTFFHAPGTVATGRRGNEKVSWTDRQLEAKTS